jgi:hypothetical protein
VSRPRIRNPSLQQRSYGGSTTSPAAPYFQGTGTLSMHNRVTAFNGEARGEPSVSEGEPSDTDPSLQSSSRFRLKPPL